MNTERWREKEINLRSGKGDEGGRRQKKSDGSESEVVVSSFLGQESGFKRQHGDSSVIGVIGNETGQTSFRCYALFNRSFVAECPSARWKNSREK